MRVVNAFQASVGPPCGARVSTSIGSFGSLHSLKRDRSAYVDDNNRSSLAAVLESNDDKAAAAAKTSSPSSSLSPIVHFSGSPTRQSTSPTNNNTSADKK